MQTPTDLKRFKYRDSTKVIYKVGLGVCLAAVLIILRQRAFYVLEEPIQTSLLKLVLACSVPLSISFRLFFWIRPRLYSVYELSEDHIKKTFKKKTDVIDFDEIKEIKISKFSPRFLGGFTIYLKNGHKIVILSALKNSHRILEAILAKRPELLDPWKVQKYLAQSRKVDVSWKRMREKLRGWKLLLFELVAWPLLISIVAAGYQPLRGPSFILSWAEWVAIFLGCSFTIQLAFNSLEEHFALQSVKWVEEKNKYERNLDYEKKIARIFSGLNLLAQIALATLILRSQWIISLLN